MALTCRNNRRQKVDQREQAKKVIIRAASALWLQIILRTTSERPVPNNFYPSKPFRWNTFARKVF